MRLSVVLAQVKAVEPHPPSYPPSSRVLERKLDDAQQENKELKAPLFSKGFVF